MSPMLGSCPASRRRPIPRHLALSLLTVASRIRTRSRQMRYPTKSMPRSSTGNTCQSPFISSPSSRSSASTLCLALWSQGLLDPRMMMSSMYRT